MLNINTSKNTINTIKNKIISKLSETGDIQRVESLNKYLKNKVMNRGNPSKNIQNVYRHLKKQDEDYKKLNSDEKFILGTLLLESNYIDDKTVGSSILSEIHKSFDDNKFEEIKKVIRNGNVNEWATCDNLAAKIFKPFSLISKENAVKISLMKDDDNIWIRRISCVTFITRIKYGEKKPNFVGFIKLMFEICETNIKYEERFNQLATGWLLRELSAVDKNEYFKFFYKNYEFFSREGLRYSLEKLSVGERKKILAYRGNNLIEE